MRVSLDWLSDFVDLPPLADLCERLVNAGIEVEDIFDPASSITDVVVAEIKSIAPHPDADRLQICRIFDGTQEFDVVCGAPNVTAGVRVAFARIGAQLPGQTIARRTIRGVEGAGMLCSRSELGLEEGKSPGLWLLPDEYTLGRSVLVEAQVSAVLTLGITPNRPDLLSHLGVGRELAAFTGKRTKPAKWRATEKGPDVGSLARVLVEDNQGCRRYVARVVRGLKIGPSPAWLKGRLESIGQRSINNVVDATNYVLHELGQPLHAFDLARLAVESGCPTLRVRRAIEGEKLRTLDEVERVLSVEDLIIADANRPVALAGVMGGLDTEVSNNTVSVLIESAYFDAARVRASAKRHGLRTEGALRFGRGADPGMAVRAVDRCAQLLAEIAEGDVAKGLLEAAPKMDLGREIALRLDQVPRILGISLPAEAVVQLLEPLEIRCTGRTEASLVFQAPSFRPDISREIDLIEEVARRHGYDRIPERLPDPSGVYAYEAMPQRPSDVARHALMASGCTETVSYGFGSPSRFAVYAPQEGEALRLMNPLGEELSALRTTLVPGLLTTMVRNQQRGSKHIRIFEVGTVFHGRTGSPEEDERDRDLPSEEVRAAVALSGGRDGGRWYEGRQVVDFADLAGVVESLVASFDAAAPLRFVAAPTLGSNPHSSAEIWLGDTRVGTAGQLAPVTLTAWELSGPVLVAELSLGIVNKLPKREARYTPLPKFPGTRRDLAVIAARTVNSDIFRQFLQEHAGGKLGASVVERVSLFDVYTGKPVPPTHVSLAFAIEYRHRERTLTDLEVSEAFAQVQVLLTEKFGVEVRQ